MIGCHIYDSDKKYEVLDQANIKGIMYLLVEGEDNSYAIYKIVSVHENVRLSNKKVLLNQKVFSNPAYWKYESTVQIDVDGNIESVKSGSLFTMKGPVCVRIIICE